MIYGVNSHGGKHTKAGNVCTIANSRILYHIPSVTYSVVSCAENLDQDVFIRAQALRSEERGTI